MADERWKLLEGEYGIKSQEDWDKRSDLGKEMLLKDKAFFDELHEDEYKKEADIYRDNLVWLMKGRERYDYNFEHAAEHADEEWNWAHNEEVMDQAKSDFASNKKLQKKFGCWENLFFDRTLPEMISMIEGVVNGLAIDILPYTQKWMWNSGNIDFKDWMNWYDKIVFASIQPFKYWENNIYTLDQSAEYYTNFYQRVGNYFSTKPEDERNPFEIKYSFLEPIRRPVIIRSLWYRSFYYHSFILRYDLHDALNAFIGFGSKEDHTGNLAIGGFAVTGFGASYVEEEYAELNKIKPLLSSAQSYVYMEQLFPFTYGLQGWEKNHHSRAEKKEWKRYYAIPSLASLGYAWTEYPRYLLGSKRSPIDAIAKYLK